MVDFRFVDFNCPAGNWRRGREAGGIFFVGRGKSLSGCVGPRRRRSRLYNLFLLCVGEEVEEEYSLGRRSVRASMFKIEKETKTGVDL